VQPSEAAHHPKNKETQVIRNPIAPLDWHKILPFRTDAASARLGWVGLQAARCRAEPAFERSVPALAHHRLVFVARPPDELELRFEGVTARTFARDSEASGPPAPPAARRPPLPSRP